MPITREDIERARAQLGLAGGVQEAADPAPSGGFLGDVLGGVGQAFSFVDEPLSNRLGVDLPGPLDFLLEEATRPTTLAIALGGAGLAPRIAGLGFRGAGLASSIIAPAAGGGFGTRLAAETALGLGARGGAELTQRFAPEDTPAPARIALGLAGGVLGGAAGLGATRAGVRRAVGRDLLAPPPRIAVRPTEIETAPRKGFFLNVRTRDHLGDQPAVTDVLRVAREADLSGFNAAERLTSRGIRLAERLGRTQIDATGNLTVPGIRRIDGQDAPAYLQEILEFGSTRFDLTPDQERAVRAFQSMYTGDAQSLRAERRIFEIDPEEADLLDGQSFISRSVVRDAGGVEGGGGRRLSGISERRRVIKDPLVAIREGVVYDHPVQALDQYARRTFEGAANEHVARMLRDIGSRPLDRVDREVGGAVRKLRAQLSGRIRTRTAQEARLSVLDDSAARTQRHAAEALEREFIRAETLESLQAVAPTAGDITELRRLARAATSDAIDFARAEERARALARELNIKLSATDKLLTGDAKRLRALTKQIDDLLTGTEGLSAQRVVSERGREIHLATAQATEQAASAVRASQHRRLLRLVTQLERSMARLSDKSRTLDDRISEALNRAATAQEIGGNARLQIDEALKAEREAMRINQRLRGAQLELRAAKNEQRRTTGRAIAETGRAERTGARLASTELSIEQLEERLDAARASWERAKDIAARIPEGRARVDPNLAPKLAGVDFPEADAKRIADWYARGKPPAGQFGKTVNAVKVGNRFLIPLRATADLSATLNQLAAFAVTNPRKFVANFGHALRDAIGFQHYDRYLDEVAEDAARHQVAILGRGRHATSDFEFESWFERIPVLKDVLGPFQRHFQAFTTRMRVDTYNSIVDTAARSGAPLDDLARDQVGRSLNRLSGISTGRAGDVETLLEFAPNFLRSTMETFWTAARDGSIEGQIARQYMRNLVGFSVLLSASVAVMQGRDPREVLNPVSASALSRGELRLNPNFLTVRLPAVGQDVSLMGRFDSFARLVVLAIDAGRGAVSEQSLAPVVDAIEFAARTKGSPFLSLGLATGSGRTFTGQEFPSVEGLAGELLPFSWASLIEDARLGPGAMLGGAALNSLGAKANPVTPFEKIQEASRVLFGKQLDELTGEERAAVDEAVPSSAQRFREQNERLARQGDERAQARLRTDEIDTERLGVESALVLAFQSGELSRRGFAEAVDELQRTTAIRKREARDTLGVEFPVASAGAARALSAWYDTFDQAALPGTDVVDWERRDELEAQLFALIAQGEFGDPEFALRTINERRRVEHAEPLVQQHFANKDLVAQSGYYDVRDAEFLRFAAAIQRVAPEVQSYGGLLQAINRAELAGDARTLRALRMLQSRIDSRTSTMRRRLRLTSQEIDDALVSLGRVSAPIRPR